VDHRYFLFECHLAKQFIDTRVAGYGGHRLRHCQCRATATQRRKHSNCEALAETAIAQNRELLI
jgi:hypothetical protein